jgi:predicted nucleic acid-binding protein
MGAHTAMAFALAWPERVSALIQITPAYNGRPRDDDEEIARCERLADGLDNVGVDGFLEAYEPGADERYHDTILKVTRQRLERHRHLDAVADAIRVVPRSLAFEGMEELEHVDIPTLIVASHDEADPGHPYAIGERMAATITASGTVLIFAPPLLRLENINVAGRRWRWNKAALVELAAGLDDLGFELSEPDLGRVAYWTARGLTAYAGAYVAVAEATGTRLVTDDDLIVTTAGQIAHALAATEV